MWRFDLRFEGEKVALEPIDRRHADGLFAAGRPEEMPAQFEGIHRDDRLLRDGRRRSSAFYSILDSEWPDVEKVLSHRLRAHSVTFDDGL